jgi:deoxyadenosine/deoxycytidine kinase
MPVALEPILSLLFVLDAMDGVSENVDKRALVGKLYRELEKFQNVLDVYFLLRQSIQNGLDAI